MYDTSETPDRLAALDPPRTYPTVQKRDQRDAAMRTLGIPVTLDNQAQFDVLMDVMDLYVAREGIHGGAWKRLGALNNLARLATKVERLLNQFWYKQAERNGDEDVPDMDDAYDAISYAVFVIRQAGNSEWTRG